MKQLRNYILGLSGPMRQGLHNFLIAVYLKTHADARLSASKEYVIPLNGQLIEKNEFFDSNTENDSRYPQVLGSVVSILPVIKSEELHSE